jgi:DNA polymerase-1
VNKRPPRNGEKTQKVYNTLLIDGNALFKTGYFGAKDEYNSNGQHVGGLYQFLTTMRMLLVGDLYHRVFVFWDGKFSGKLRYQIYEPYKSGRNKDYINGTHPIEESELQQRKLIWEYLNELYVRQIMHEIIEGDDFIAYYCINKKPNEKITICTNDRDMAQLIREDVRIYFLGLKTYVDVNNFTNVFEYHNENAALIKTMVGDASDSIKGIKGLGVTKLLSLFPMLKERKVLLNEIIEEAKKQQEERLQNKKKPLSVLDNIINSVTDGVQGKDIYEINDKLVNLKYPMMTEDGIWQLNELIENTLDSSGRDIKKVFEYMKRDGLDKTIGETRYDEYLIPFKKLIQRENILL